MIPRLQRFYGGELMAWLTRVPIGLMRACLTMLPRLQAEEALTARTAVALGTGSYERSDAREITDTWLQQAQAPRAGRGRPAPAASPEALSGVGIGYQVVEGDCGP